MKTQLDPRALARFLPEFERPDFSPGEVIPKQKREDGVYITPHATLSQLASDFVEAAYDGGWVLRDFNWIEWKDSEEAKALYHDAALLAKATPRQLAQLLTVFIRADRFTEGGLLSDFKSGHILVIVRRAAQLVGEGGVPSEP